MWVWTQYLFFQSTKCNKIFFENQSYIILSLVFPFLHQWFCIVKKLWFESEIFLIHLIGSNVMTHSFFSVLKYSLFKKSFLNNLIFELYSLLFYDNICPKWCLNLNRTIFRRFIYVLTRAKTSLGCITLSGIEIEETSGNWKWFTRTKYTL